MTDEWTRAEKRKAQSEQAKAIMDFVSMLSDKINELEKENEELRNNGFTVSAMTEQLKVALEKGKQLEKENAELREKLEDADNCDRLGDVITQAYKDQLTKAKKLLEKLLITSCNSDVLILFPNCSEVLRVRVEAEQFLKEIEKWQRKNLKNS